MHERWDQAATIRRNQIESGIDVTFTHVFVPFYKHLLRKYQPSDVLDVGCGTGHLLKNLLKPHISFSGIEPSRGMYATCRTVLKNTDVKISQCRIQEFDTRQRYDLIIAHLCFQTFNDVNGALNTIQGLMRKHGTLVVTIPHPCFWNEYQEYIPRKNFVYMRFHKNLVNLTISKDRKATIGPIPYFHRPLTFYFDQVQQNGLFVKTLHEIFPKSRIHKMYPQPWKAPRYVALICGIQT